MPTLPCPACDKPTARLEHPPDDDPLVNYYRCGHCGHFWTTTKDDTDIVKHITPLTRKPPSRR